MNNTISTAGAKLAKTSALPECFEILAEAGYRTIDFWLCSYSHKADAPMRRDNWREWVRDTGALMKKNGLTAGQVHCYWAHPHQVNEDMTYDMPHEIIHRNIEACSMLDCRRLIFHPIQRWFPFEENMRGPILDANAEWFRALLPDAEKFGVELHIENLFDHKHVGSTDGARFPFASADDIMYVIGKLDHPLVKTCLDTGHANINGLDIPAMIRQYGPKLGSLHLNDNYGKIGPIYEDLHLFPGNGRIDWKEVFAALKEIGYAGTLNMEPGAELDRLNHEQRVIQLTAGRLMLENMREIYG